MYRNAICAEGDRRRDQQQPEKGLARVLSINRLISSAHSFASPTCRPIRLIGPVDTRLRFSARLVRLCSHCNVLTAASHGNVRDLEPSMTELREKILNQQQIGVRREHHNRSLAIRAVLSKSTSDGLIEGRAKKHVSVTEEGKMASLGAFFVGGCGSNNVISDDACRRRVHSIKRQSPPRQLAVSTM
jgi:hypothetical protein